MHQTHACQLYIGAICPIATFGLPIFWKSRRGKVLNTLNLMQNKCLRMVTGAFRTTNITAMEIEASIPLINLWMDHKLDMEALRLARLTDDHALTCRIYPEQRENKPPYLNPPLPTFNPNRAYRCNPKEK